MIGNEIKPIEITAAATTPVVAASKAPTKITAIARPPRTGPNTCPTVSSKSSAMRERSRMIPMKVKNGIANRVSLDMMPITLSGRAWKRLVGNRPASMPMKPNNKPVAAKPKATGMPVSKNMKSPANISGTKFCAMKAVMSAPPHVLRRQPGLGFGSQLFCEHFLCRFFMLQGKGLRKVTSQKSQSLD